MHSSAKRREPEREGDAMGDANLLDLLLDLNHDLGKYVPMPLTFLPRPAPPGEVRSALRRALLETRSSPQGVVTARQLWERFLTQAGPTLAARPAFGRLTAVVARALAWESLVGQEAPLDRAAIERDLAAIGPAIRAVIGELNGNA